MNYASTSPTTVLSPIFTMENEYLPETLVRFDLFACRIYFTGNVTEEDVNRTDTTQTADKQHLLERFIPEKTFTPESEKI